MRVYECCRRFVWCALALLLLVGALLPRAAHAISVDDLPIGSAAVLDVAQALKPEERAAQSGTMRSRCPLLLIPITMKAEDCRLLKGNGHEGCSQYAN